MAPVRIYWSVTRIFFTQKAFHRRRTRLCRAGGTRRCGGETSRVPAPPGRAHGEHGRAPLLFPPPAAPLGPTRGLPRSLGACPQARPQRPRGAAYPGGLRRHRAAGAAPSPPAGLSRAGRRLQTTLPAALPSAPLPLPALKPTAPRLSRSARPRLAPAPPPHRAAAQSPRAPAAAPAPHLLEFVVGGPGRHPQDVVELRVGHIRHGGSGRRAQAGTGRGAARARPGAG